MLILYCLSHTGKPQTICTHSFKKSYYYIVPLSNASLFSTSWNTEQNASFSGSFLIHLNHTYASSHIPSNITGDLCELSHFSKGTRLFPRLCLCLVCPPSSESPYLLSWLILISRYSDVLFENFLNSLALTEFLLLCCSLEYLSLCHMFRDKYSII